MTIRDLPAWTPFERATPIPMTAAEIEAQWNHVHNARPDLTRETFDATIVDLDNDTIFRNSRYQVNVRALGELIHLSIKRLDKDRVGRERYRDFMRIKDQLVGPDHEGVEIYPARSREIDSANQYHIWVFADPSIRVPFGFNDGRFVDGDSVGNARQHPLEP